MIGRDWQHFLAGGIFGACVAVTMFFWPGCDPNRPPPPPDPNRPGPVASALPLESAPLPGRLDTIAAERAELHKLIAQITERDRREQEELLSGITHGPQPREVYTGLLFAPPVGHIVLFTPTELTLVLVMTPLERGACQRLHSKRVTVTGHKIVRDPRDTALLVSTITETK